MSSLLKWLSWLVAGVSCHGAIYNLKVVTDASPDYSDMESLVRSATARWQTPEEKCWAMFYWNHVARRQTAPMMLHGLALTDPIRQFNDYGFAMCSTISGINCAIWDAMGLSARYWDISLHTVPEVQYGGRWHMYDNSMSAIYTLCDGKTIASVQEIGADGSCPASDGRTELGHVAKYHCLTATSSNGFLTGADTIRGLDEESRCFNPNGLKYRNYFYDWDRGHRYILNLRRGEAYTRFYRSLGTSREFYVPNENGADPEKANERYRIRGNGTWRYSPALRPETVQAEAHAVRNLVTLPAGGLMPAGPGPGEVIFKVDGANVITSLRINARFLRGSPSDSIAIAVSTVNGLAWRDVWRADTMGEIPAQLALTDEVNGAYEVLIKVVLTAAASPASAQLRSLAFETTTMVNGKTQPRLLIGRNTVHVEAGAPTESIVFWPDLQSGKHKTFVSEENNIRAAETHPGYMGVMHAAEPGKEAWVTFRLDAPRPVQRVVYGGRFYNRAPGSRIDLLHSFDDGRTWTQSYSLTNTSPPWDVIQYSSIDNVPQGTRGVLFKYRLNGPAAGPAACSIYAVRMEAQHAAVDPTLQPMAVTFNWSERKDDYSLIERSHTEVIRELPHRYVINVGGADHPVVNWMRIASLDALPAAPAGYADDKDAGGEKWHGRWVTWGRNLARGKPYTVSAPSTSQWGSGDPDGRRLTDGIVGPPYPGGVAPTFALGWDKGMNPVITVDLEAPQKCSAFRIQIGAGWPWWDALKGEIRDKVELLTSTNGTAFTSHGNFNLNLRWKDLPANHFWPDEEVIAAHPFELVLPAPVTARYVRYRITPARSLTVSEVEVFDTVRSEPFDLRVALPEAASQKSGGS